MNLSDAKAIKDFVNVVRKNGDNSYTVLKVPGHKGRTYYVKVEPECASTLRVTCRKKDATTCPGNWNGTICYHCLAAVEHLYKDVAWCESEADAKRRANLGGRVLEIRSTQGNGRAWVVVPGEKVTDEEREFHIAGMAVELTALNEKLEAEGSLSGTDYKRLQELRRQFGVLKMCSSAIINLAAKHRLERGREVLRGSERDQEGI